MFLFYKTVYIFFILIKIEVLDHHVNENLYSPLKKRIELVGSAATLVAEEITNEQTEMEEKFVELLIAPIIIDTNNLDPNLGKTTPKDEEMVEKLCKIAKLDKNFLSNLNEILSNEKFNVSSLTNEQLFLKDYKQFDMNGVSVGIPSILSPVSSLLEKEKLNNESLLFLFSRFCSERKLDVLVAMTSFTSNDKFQRELIVYVKDNKNLHDSICSHFNICETDKGRLDLVSFDTPQDYPNFVSFFKQNNTKASRKQIQPALVQFFG